MTNTGTVKALYEFGLVDAPYEADAVTKVSEVGQPLIAPRRVHCNWSTDHWNQVQASAAAAYAAWECHCCILQWVVAESLAVCLTPCPTISAVASCMTKWTLTVCKLSKAFFRMS